MDTSLQKASMAAQDLEQAQSVDQETAEAEHHIHLPGPSYWPLILSAAVLLDIFALLSMPDSMVLLVLSAPLTLLGILGWAFEDPMGGHQHTTAAPVVSLSRHELHDKALEAVENTVTFGSTAYSAHPIKVDVEDEGVITLSGKVELEAQRQRMEDAVWQVPGVRQVNNFVVAEDTILRRANERIASLREKGKLDGATDLSVLVENYILSLYGKVSSTAMKYTLEKEMIGIPGVRVVVNHIGLNKEIPGNLGHTLNKVGGV